MNLHAVTGNILLLYQLATLVETECHDWTNIACIGNDSGMYVRFLDMVDRHKVRQARRIVHLL